MTPTAGHVDPKSGENHAPASMPKPAHTLPRVKPGRGFLASIPVTVVNHHAHLTAGVIEQLFCDLYRLHPSGPALRGGQYATMETVNLIGPEGRLRKVPIVGPPSAVNQIEISRTDALILGIRAPVREPGDWVGTPGVILEGPRSQVTLGTGLICPLRLVRMGPTEAQRLGLKDRDRVEVGTHSPDRNLCFPDVLVQVAPDHTLELCLDTDEANAAGLRTGDYAQITCP